MVRDTSLCGLGQTAPNPVLSSLRWFRSDYEAGIAAPPGLRAAPQQPEAEPLKPEGSPWA